jgi:hypothetical protein
MVFILYDTVKRFIKVSNQNAKHHIIEEEKAMKICNFFICLLLASQCLEAQPIPPYFFSQNAWMSDTLGDYDRCPGAAKGLHCKLWGKIHQNNNWQKVKLSGVKLIRFGGEHADENMPTRRQYLQMVDSARAKGIEPLLQVP